MAVGDALTAVIHEDRYLLLDDAGTVLGRLSAAASERLTAVTNAGWSMERASVRAFQRRYAHQGDPGFADGYRRERWDAVVPLIEVRRNEHKPR